MGSEKLYQTYVYEGKRMGSSWRDSYVSFLFFNDAKFEIFASKNVRYWYRWLTFTYCMFYAWERKSTACANIGDNRIFSSFFGSPVTWWGTEARNAMKNARTLLASPDSPPLSQIHIGERVVDLVRSVEEGYPKSANIWRPKGKTGPLYGTRLLEHSFISAHFQRIPCQ